MTTKKNPWLEHVAKFKKAHPTMKYKDVLVKAKKSYKGKDKSKSKSKSKSKKRTTQKKKGGSNHLLLTTPEARFSAGVTSLNSGLAEIGRPIF